ncbi:hypothetical protein BJ322DRAFT_495081 [Thelephora terrestris]|uniref:BTB domain-containing protein n=1 Tax=Thelephora terrestris TaxID=56493 RepID=A0A9P6H3V4_9AGAM|nr:hypothetical protein BJ322DRAFT_495081 [Thelephora terrestris]
MPAISNQRTPTPNSLMIACTPPLLEVLNDSISSGKFVDTKIILFSRRNSSGTVCKPRALYANSSVLRTVPYFNDLLFGKFGEAESKSFSEPLEDTESADDYGYCSDSDLEEDEDGSTSSKVAQGQTTLARGNGSDPFNFPPIENKPPPTCGEYQEHPEKGKVIKIQDMAFITFQAFVLYLYTNSIEFAPYGTEDNRKPRSAEIISVSENSIPRPSPKSIYRLADKYDVPALKKLASESIRDNLKHCDIVGEIFSKFTSRYDEVRAMQINHLASVRFGGDGAVKKKLCDEIDEKVDAYVAGDLKHAAEAVSLLWEASKDRRPIAVPQNTSIFVRPAPFYHLATNTFRRHRRQQVLRTGNV